MTSRAKRPASAESSLRLVVVGQGATRGRRPHLLRLRESLVSEFNQVSDGQLYLRVELLIQRAIAELKARPPGIEVIQVSQLEPSPHDEHLLDQRQARLAKAASASSAKPTATKQSPRKQAPVATVAKKAPKTKVSA